MEDCRYSIEFVIKVVPTPRLRAQIFLRYCTIRDRYGVELFFPYFQTSTPTPSMRFLTGIALRYDIRSCEKISILNSFKMEGGGLGKVVTLR